MQGFSEAGLARIRRVLQTEIEKGTLPGAVTLIVHRGHIVHHEACGYLDAAKSKPMSRDAVFRAFSMTKPFVSTATMMLVEEGRLKLSDPISSWIPELNNLRVLQADGQIAAAQRPITLHDLLRHTSGFCYAFLAPWPEIRNAYHQADIESVETDLSGEEMVRRLSDIPLAWQPGTHFQYGLSTDVLGILLERVTQKRLDHLLDEMVFRPLGMADTNFHPRPDQMRRLADALDSDSLKGLLWKDARVEVPPGKRFIKGGSGSVTTAHDYSRFAQMILRGGEFEGVRLLSRKTVELMLSDHIPGFEGSPEFGTGPGYGFGLGFAVRRQDGFAVIPGSKGDVMWAGIGGTSFTIDPREELIGVFMAQAPSHRFHLRMLFKNLLYAALI